MQGCKYEWGKVPVSYKVMRETGSEQSPEPLSASQEVESQVSQTHIPGFLVMFLFLTLNILFPLTSTVKRHYSARKTAGENLTLNFGSVLSTLGFYISHFTFLWASTNRDEEVLDCRNGCLRASSMQPDYLRSNLFQHYVTLGRSFL